MEKEIIKLRESLFNEFEQIPIICIHSHIDVSNPTAKDLSDLLDYHYYTELANSSLYGENWLCEGITQEEKVKRIIEKVSNITHTTQYSWLITLSKFFFGFKHDKITDENWIGLSNKIKEKAKDVNWYHKVIKKSNIEKIFLTNRFYENLENLDSIFIPTFRVDDIVFDIHKKETIEKLENVTNVSMENLKDFCKALETRFMYFIQHRAASVSISMPPNFQTKFVSINRASIIFDKVLKSKVRENELITLQAYMINVITEKCQKYSMPFQLMIGVLRDRYRHGVYQGKDLFNPVSSMTGYEYLFNQFPNVNFLISVLPDTQVHEMRIYCWIRHNVKVSGHWWYQNTPSMIKSDITTRIEILPDNKMIGYYSDAYKLEFIFPKFRMYKKILAEVLAEKVIRSYYDSDIYTTHYTEEDAYSTGKKLLYENPKNIFDLK